MNMSWIQKILCLFNIRQKLAIILLILLGVGSALLDTISTYIILPFVYAIIDQEKITSGTMEKVYLRLNCSSNTDFSIKLAIIIALLYLFTAAYKVMQAVITARFRNSTRHSLAVKTFDKTIYAPYKEITHINSSEVQRIISSDINRVNAVVVQLMSVMTSILTSASLIAVLWTLNKQITIFAGALIIVVIFLINKPVSTRVKKIGKKITNSNTNMVKITQQYFGGYKTIIACGRQEAVERSFISESIDNSQAYLQASTLEAIPLNLSQGIIMAAIFVYMAVITLHGANLTTMLPTLATFALAAMKLLPLVGRISSAFVAIKVDVPAIDSVYDFLYVRKMDRNVFLDNPDIPKECSERTLVREGIFVEDVSFAFDDSDQDLFKNVSLSIPLNSTVGFIGPTGAGKTTLVDLIVGLYEPKRGIIRVGDINIHQSRKWWASQIGYISQHIYLMDDTIRANIVYGYDDGKNDDQIWECLKDACIDDYIKSLPDGLDTLCGENGVRFSGGQQQRLGIARALYSNPSVLVFDEATSALDTETEASIVQSINNLSGKKTMIIIAHRLSTIENCDHVYKIDAGSVVRVR